MPTQSTQLLYYNLQINSKFPRFFIIIELPLDGFHQKSFNVLKVIFQNIHLLIYYRLILDKQLRFRKINLQLLHYSLHEEIFE